MIEKEMFDAGWKSGRIESLVGLRNKLKLSIAFQEEDHTVAQLIKYKMKGIKVSRPLLPGLKEAVKQINKMLGEIKREHN